MQLRRIQVRDGVESHSESRDKAPSAVRAFCTGTHLLPQHYKKRKTPTNSLERIKFAHTIVRHTIVQHYGITKTENLARHAFPVQRSATRQNTHCEACKAISWQDVKATRCPIQQRKNCSQTPQARRSSFGFGRELAFSGFMMSSLMLMRYCDALHEHITRSDSRVVYD